MSLLLPGSVSQITEGLSRLCSPLLRETDDDDDDDRRGNDGRPGASTTSPSAEPQVPSTRVGGISLGLTCGTCGKVFDDASDQRAHFKTDFHRFNVKRTVAGRPPLTEDVLEAIIAAGDDLSSISGSDSEAEEDETAPRSGPADGARSTSFMVFFRYEDEEGEATVFGIPRGVLFPRSYARKGRESREDFESNSRAALARLSRSQGYWAVVMASGGHFAAAIFASKSENARPLLHKTLHRYVVRAKAGGRQAAKDATGKKASSAGASLRRHNEKALAEDIQTLLGLTWKEEMAKSDRIFLSAPGTHNSNIFFGGKTPIFDARDERIHAVPFSTRRPTLKETCRIKALLSTVYDLPPPAPDKKEARQRDLEGLGGQGAGEAPPRERGSGGAAAPLESGEREEVVVVAEESDLHAATRLGDAYRVLSLLEGGADPCSKDLRGRAPYLLAKTKEVRDTYRRYRARAGEGAFDWKASGVPQALTPELEEQQRKKKAEKDAKRKKEKQKRKSEQAARKAAQAKREEEEEKKRAEEEEKARKREEQRKPKPFDMFSAQRLSRREIMARAAEGESALFSCPRRLVLADSFSPRVCLLQRG